MTYFVQDLLELYNSGNINDINGHVPIIWHHKEKELIQIPSFCIAGIMFFNVHYFVVINIYAEKKSIPTFSLSQIPLSSTPKTDANTG